MSIRYFVDTAANPRRYYAAFVDEADDILLVNVEKPSEPPYFLPFAALFDDKRFQDVEVRLGIDYIPTRFRLRERTP